MTNDYLPPGIWYALVEIAMKNGIAIKEVQVTLLRHILENDFGFKCSHPEDKIRTKDRSKVYCTYCWTRLVTERQRKLDPMNRSKILPAIHKPKPTFLDKNEDQILDPFSSLQPDQRGGE